MEELMTDIILGMTSDTDHHYCNEKWGTMHELGGIELLFEGAGLAPVGDSWCFCTSVFWTFIDLSLGRDCITKGMK